MLKILGEIILLIRCVNFNFIPVVDGQKKNLKKREINIKDIGYENIIKFQERFQKVT